MLNPSDFGELRSALMVDVPTSSDWARLCELAQALEVDLFSAVAQPYLLAHLERWPSALRAAPSAWTKRALVGEERFMRLMALATSWSLAQPRPLKLPALDAWIACGSWQRVQALKLSGGVLSGRLFARLLERCTLEQLVELECTRAGLGQIGLDAMMEAALPSLERLKLSVEYVTISRLLPFAQRASWWPQLRKLDLSDNMLHPETLLRLGEHGLLNALYHLDVSANLLRGEVGSWLTPLGGLEVLSLSHTGLDDAHALSLDLDDGAGRWRQLDISSNALGPVGLECLLHSPPCARLERLDVSHNAIGDEGLMHLVEAPCALTLRHLDLSLCGVTDQGAAFLVTRADRLSALESLNLRMNELGERGRRALLSHPTLSEAIKRAEDALA